MCELVVEDITRRVEKAFGEKKVLAGVFLNIEGAFDNIAYESIKRDAEWREIGTPIAKWIDFALRNRITQTSVATSIKEVSVTWECPHGALYRRSCGA